MEKDKATGNSKLNYSPDYQGFHSFDIFSKRETGFTGWQNFLNFHLDSQTKWGKSALLPVNLPGALLLMKAL